MNQPGMLLSLLVIGLAQERPQQPEPVSPDDVITRLISGRHGLGRLHPDAQQICDEIASNPTVYGPSVVRALRLPSDGELSELHNIHRVQRALSIARMMEPSATQQAVRTLFDQTTDRVRIYRDQTRREYPTSQPADAPARGVFALRRGAIDTLSALQDPYAVEKVLDSLEEEDIGSRMSMILYVAHIGQSDRHLAERLARMAGDKNSKLYRDPQLLLSLKQIEEARQQGAAGDSQNAGRNAERKPDAPKPKAAKPDPPKADPPKTDPPKSP